VCVNGELLAPEQPPIRSAKVLMMSESQSKTIRVSRQLYDKLESLGTKRDTFESIIGRLLVGASKK